MSVTKVTIIHSFLFRLNVQAIVLGALIGTVATIIKIVLYLGVGAFVFYGIKKLVDEK